MIFTLEVSLRRRSAALLLMLGTVLLLLVGGTSAYTDVRTGADPTVMRVGSNYYSAESAEGGIWVREAPTLEGLSKPAQRKKVWTWIHFAAGDDHRMYAISADSPLGSYPGAATKVSLPDDRWAIDAVMFTFGGQRYLVWSGWESTENIEQNLYIARMSSPTQATGSRYIISQPREPWESVRDGNNPLINEGPEAIVDPDGQLHIVYSANGSWGPKYCLADLRLKKGGDPTSTWDWHKSNGCLFGSHQENMMPGWDATLGIDGPGHHTFALPNGDVGASPGGTDHIPFMFHGVAKGTPYSWDSRHWYTGSFVWWANTKYTRKDVPGDNENVGYSFKFFEA
ncbi:glycoside hydrolase family 43 protein [Apiospora hydei]|uniref:Glycoside hydrolase family 43 protein n=1 Tax=Apiospora hydei TaxID=1337664 RepID=A0ABR1W7K6_9PEZI